jgi:hypothetical protein
MYLRSNVKAVIRNLLHIISNCFSVLNLYLIEYTKQKPSVPSWELKKVHKLFSRHKICTHLTHLSSESCKILLTIGSRLYFIQKSWTYFLPLLPKPLFVTWFIKCFLLQSPLEPLNSPFWESADNVTVRCVEGVNRWVLTCWQERE